MECELVWSNEWWDGLAPCLLHLDTVYSSREVLASLEQLSIAGVGDGCLGIGTGNPGVFQGYLHPYPRKPAPVPKGTGTGTGSAKTRGYATHVPRVCPKTNSETSQQQCKLLRMQTCTPINRQYRYDLLALSLP